DGVNDSWDATVEYEGTDEYDNRCRVVTFRPPTGHDGPWEGADIFARHGQVVTLLSICGVDQAALDTRDEDQDARDDLADTIDDVATTSPEDRRPLALDPDTRYEIEVRWSWQAWQATDGEKTPPAAVDSNAWTPADPEVFTFATAPATTDPPEVPDGLNEYLFDASDVGRYVIATEPADGRGTHFVDDPIWIHFEVDHIETLLDQYGHELAIEVRRTDPPPQRGADISMLIAPLATQVAWLPLATQYQATGTRALNQAVLDSPCLPDGSPFGGASAAVDVELDPDADYDLLLTAKGGTGGDRVIRATRFHTSRYAEPDELVAALGFGATGASPPDELILTDDQDLPAGDLVVGDLTLDEALRDIGADTLPLPSYGCRTYLLWRLEGSAWRIAGVLLDSLETMSRQRTVVDADGVAGLGDRAVLERLEIGGRHLDPVRANANWTRVLLVPSTTIEPSGDDLDLVIRTDAADATGSRHLPPRPLLLDREGLL
ncbi:MAG: hypothetical protein AAFP84_20990, partial [Actinomycetota bacterium]